MERQQQEICDVTARRFWGWAVVVVWVGLGVAGCSVELDVPVTCVGDRCGETGGTTVVVEDVGEDSVDVAEDPEADVADDVLGDVALDTTDTTPPEDVEDDTDDVLMDIVDEDTGSEDVVDEDTSTGPETLASSWTFPATTSTAQGGETALSILTESRQLTAAVNMTTDRIENIQLASLVGWDDLAVGDEARFSARQLTMVQVQAGGTGETLELYQRSGDPLLGIFDAPFEAPAMRKAPWAECFLTSSYREADGGDPLVLWFGSNETRANTVLDHVCNLEGDTDQPGGLNEARSGNMPFFQSPRLHLGDERVVSAVFVRDRMRITRIGQGSVDTDREDPGNGCDIDTHGHLFGVLQDGTDWYGFTRCNALQWVQFEDGGNPRPSISEVAPERRLLDPLTPGIVLPASQDPARPAVYLQVFRTTDNEGQDTAPYIMFFDPTTGESVGAQRIVLQEGEGANQICASQNVSAIPFERDGAAFAELFDDAVPDNVSTDLLVTLRMDSGCPAGAEESCACAGEVESDVYAFDLNVVENAWSATPRWSQTDIGSYLTGPLVGDVNRDGTQEVVFGQVPSLNPVRAGRTGIVMYSAESGEEEDAWLFAPSVSVRAGECQGDGQGDPNDRFFELPVALLPDTDASNSPVQLLTAQIFAQHDPCNSQEDSNREGLRLNLYTFPKTGNDAMNIQWPQRISNGSYDGVYAPLTNP